MTRAAVLVSAALLAAGCGGRAETAATAGDAAAAPSTPAASSTSSPAACTLVTAAEMSAFVGTPLTAGAEEGGGAATCRYAPPAASMPSIEVKVEWGSGEIAMAAMGVFGRLEPGVAEALAGVGDQATAIGPAVMIRTGADLITLTLLGVDERPALIRRIVQTMRPRMGPSSQPKAADSSGGSPPSPANEDARAAAEMAGQLLGALVGEGQRASGGAERAPGELSDGPRTAAGTARTLAPLAPASAAAISRIPLVKDLVVVTARHEPDRGDYEPLFRVTELSGDGVATVFSADVPEGERLTVPRTVRRADLEEARTYRAFFNVGDPTIFAGTTAFSLSKRVYAELSSKGQTTFAIARSGNALTDALSGLLGGLGNAGNEPTEARGLLERVRPEAFGMPVLVNDRLVELSVMHVREIAPVNPIAMYILNDPENPLVLRAIGRNLAEVVRITYPESSPATSIVNALTRDARVDVHGIYFDFGQATIRPESEPVLKEIAAALTSNPAWAMTIAGHTDSVGGDSYNLELSKRRAAAVRTALVDRYGIAGARLTSEGYGASRPTASNDTLTGRAQNRRVELTRN